MFKYFETRKVKKTVKTILSTYGQVVDNKKELVFNYLNKSYVVGFLYVEKNGELFINNQTTWQVYGSRSLIINEKLKLNRNYICLVFPTLKPVKVYVNENEVEFVNNRKVYNYYVTLVSDLEVLIKKLK